MTSSIKAKELFEKFHYQICNDNGLSQCDSTEFCAKQCAMIAVNEILDGSRKLLPASRLYWEDVRKEISSI